MSDYRRVFIPGGVYFFTVVTYHRRPIFAVPENVTLLRAAFHQVRAHRPVIIDAIVVLPDHLHCIWRMPDGDIDFSGRWREIKKYVSKRIGADGTRPREKMFGNAASGSIAYETKKIGSGTWITFITIPSNMVCPHPLRNGRIRRSTRQLQQVGMT